MNGKIAFERAGVLFRGRVALAAALCCVTFASQAEADPASVGLVADPANIQIQQPTGAHHARFFEARGGQICNLIDFENMGDLVPIGTVFGTPNVTFGNSWLTLLDHDERWPPPPPCEPGNCNGNFANEPTPDHIAFFLLAVEPINFSQGVQFVEIFYSASALSLPLSLRAWTGLNGTGSLISTVNGYQVGTDHDGAACSGDPTGNWCKWFVVTFTSTSSNIRSITLTAPATAPNQFAFDNMTFCISRPQTGGCCQPNDTCTPTTAENCTSLGGRYLGDNVACAPCIITNIPPIPVNFPPGNTLTIDASAGQVLNRVVSFLSPEAGQTTTVTITDLNGLIPRGFNIINNPGNVAIISLNWAPTCNDVGSYVLRFRAVDSFVPPGVTTVDLTINVTCSCTLPVITVQPLSDILCAGDSITFHIAGIGTPPPNYQWRINGVGIPGATGTSYSINPVSDTDTANYDVDVFNTCGSIISDAANLIVWPIGTADANGDGLVDGLDLLAFLNELTHPNVGPPTLASCGADMNRDGAVNMADLPLLINALLGR